MKLNYILPLLKSVLLISVILMLVYNNANVIKAETNGQETVTDTSGWSDYDYKDIDKILKESSYNSVTFEDIVDSIHRYYNFAGRAVETVPKSLRLSCGSELT